MEESHPRLFISEMKVPGLRIRVEIEVAYVPAGTRGDHGEIAQIALEHAARLIDKTHERPPF